MRYERIDGDSNSSGTTITTITTITTLRDIVAKNIIPQVLSSETE